MKDKIKIGLEIHVPLNTRTKLFCNCKNSEEGKPNQNVCEICLGMPGAKPRLNKEAFDKSVILALALNCKINEKIIFSRKTYFYPDLPKNFQITQYENPVGISGFLGIKNKKITITRLQLEEDPGRLQHKADYSLVDYNRSGVPLVEIVTSPDFENSEQVIEFIQKMISILDYLNIYNRHAGFRVDVNISVGGGNRVEIKNISGTKPIQKAINFEIIRQKIKLKKGEKVEQQTMHFDNETGKTFLSRKKETEEDYGYIYEPDLSQIELDKKEIERLKKRIPELPFQRLERLINEYSLTESEAHVIILEKSTADLFESLSKEIDKNILKNWIAVTLRKVLNYNNLKLSETKITKEKVKELISLQESKKITPRVAELVLREMVSNDDSIEKIISRLGLSKMENRDVENLVTSVLKENKLAVEDYRNGKEKALQFLVGQVVMKTKGRANAIKVKEEILEKLKKIN